MLWWRSQEGLGRRDAGKPGSPLGPCLWIHRKRALAPGHQWAPEGGCHPLCSACQRGAKRAGNKGDRGLPWGLRLPRAFEPGCLLILISWPHSSDSSFSFTEENQRPCLPFSINTHHLSSPRLSHHPRYPRPHSLEVGDNVRAAPSSPRRTPHSWHI